MEVKALQAELHGMLHRQQQPLAGNCRQGPSVVGCRCSLTCTFLNIFIQQQQRHGLQHAVSSCRASMLPLLLSMLQVCSVQQGCGR